MIQPLSATGSGTLKGRVLDKANKEALIGANVTIQKTSLGVAADIDGNFQIKLIPVGKWNVKVSCVGYVPIVREITIKEDETAEEDFNSSVGMQNIFWKMFHPIFLLSITLVIQVSYSSYYLKIQNSKNYLQIEYKNIASMEGRLHRKPVKLDG